MINDIIRVEKNHGFKSIFFISGNSISTRIPLADPNYNLDKISDTLSKIVIEGFEIGLHPSIFSSKVNQLFKKSLLKTQKK